MSKAKAGMMLSEQAKKSLHRRVQGWEYRVQV